MEGNDILCYDDNGNLTLNKRNGEKTDMKFNKIYGVRIINYKIMVMLPDEIKLFTLYGRRIESIKPPRNYTFYRFFDHSKNKLDVVCCGNEYTADKYGRNDWHFSYDLELGYWERVSLAY